MSAAPCCLLLVTDKTRWKRRSTTTYPGSIIDLQNRIFGQFGARVRLRRLRHSAPTYFRTCWIVWQLVFHAVELSQVFHDGLAEERTRAFCQFWIPGSPACGAAPSENPRIWPCCSYHAWRTRPKMMANQTNEFYGTSARRSAVSFMVLTVFQLRAVFEQSLGAWNDADAWRWHVDSGCYTGSRLKITVKLVS